MAIVYSNGTSECTESEIKNKPKDEQKILNDDNATQTAQKKQEEASPDKGEAQSPSDSVSESALDDTDGEELDEAVSDVVGIAAAAAAAVAGITALSISSAKHKGRGAVNSAISYIASGYETYKKRHLNQIEKILKSNKEFRVSKGAMEFSKKYIDEHSRDLNEAFKCLDEAKRKYAARTEDAQIAANSQMSEESLRKLADDTKAVSVLTDKVEVLKNKLEAKAPKSKGDFFVIKNSDLLRTYSKVSGALEDGADSIREFMMTAEAAGYSENDTTSTSSDYSTTYNSDGTKASTSYSSKVTETRKVPNSLFRRKADALLELYEAVNDCYRIYVKNSLYYLSTAKNSIIKKASISEDALPEEKLATAKALVEEVQAENDIMALVNEAAEDLCLDEEYVKNEVRKEAVLNGKIMKEAKAHAKKAKAAIKKMDTKTAIYEQQQYVDTLKKLYEECNNIKDDNKMIVISTAAVRGLVSGLGALMIGVEASIVDGNARHGGITDRLAKIGDEKDQQASYEALIKHYGSKRGKIELAASAVIGVVTGIILGTIKYKKDVLKYGVKNAATNKIEIAKSRIEAQQRMRRMIRLAEQLLSEYKSIEKIESGK